MARTYYREIRDGEQHRETETLIDSQVPQFYHEDGPLFVEFLKEYYNFLHKGGNPETSAQNILKLNDIDEIGEYYDQYVRDSGGQYTTANTAWTTAANNLVTSVKDLYKKQFLLNIPTNANSFELLVKNVLSIYRSKGSERAFQVLLRGIYGVDAQIDYPRDRVIAPSDGQYRYDSYIQVIFDPNVYDFKDTTVTGLEGGAKAYIEEVIVRKSKGIIVAQLIISKDSLTGVFRHNELIESDGENKARPRVIGGMREINLTANGSGYKLGDIIDIKGNGIDGKAQITEVKNFGGIISFKLTNGGSGYQIDTPIKVVGPTGGTVASAKIVSIVDTESVQVSIDRIGAFAANSNIRLDSGIAFHTNSFINTVSVFTNDPKVGPNGPTGQRVSWSSTSNVVHLSIPSVAPYTVNVGDTITLSNSTSIINEQIKVHSLPNNHSIVLTAFPNAGASNTEGYLRTYAPNTTYRVSANLAGANISSTLGSAFDLGQRTVGKISEITTVSAGSGYNITPNVTAVNDDVSALNISDGQGGFKGRNAVITATIIPDDVVTGVIVNDHGIGYTNNTITLANPRDGGTEASGTFVIGGVSNSAASYTDVKGFLSENQSIQDSYYFQNYSYEIITERAFEDYRRTLTSVTHPAGTIMFGRFRSESAFVTGNNGLKQYEWEVSVSVKETVDSGLSPDLLGRSVLGDALLS